MKILKSLITIVFSLLCCWMYWIIIYIGFDHFTFEMATNIRGLSSAKTVYDMFLINIVMSLLIAQILTFIQYKLLARSRKTRVIIVSIQLVAIAILIYLISNTQVVIPFIKNWHISVF